MNFKEIATPLIRKGIPVIPLRPKTKIAAIENWPEKASIDPAQIEAWNSENSEYNCGCVASAKPDGVWFLELDSPEARRRIIDENPGKDFPQTYSVRSSPGRGHFYFKQTPASVAMMNIAQGFVRHGDWSARVDRQYVVSANSLHPKTDQPYEVRLDAEVAEAPQWLIVWLLSQKVEGPASAVSDDDAPIIEGGRNNSLTSMGGKLRHMGLDKEQILTTLLSINESRCRPPLSHTEVEVIAGSLIRYPVGKDTTVLFSGRAGGSAPQQVDNAAPVQVNSVEAPELWQPITNLEHPEFPRWVMDGTSLKKGFIDPICAVNTRYPEYMFMPAVALILNYLHGKVNIASKTYPLSLYMVSIGKGGKVIKSACIKDAISYCQYMSIGDYGKRDQTPSSVAGKTLVWTPGSMEGLGLDMRETQNKNAVMFYDEMDKFVKKASIESSSMLSNFTLAYEGTTMSNGIKNAKQSFNIEDYCLSALMCSTDEKFAGDWSKLCGAESGLNTRFFFLYQPKVLKDLTPMSAVSFVDGATETRKLIDKAVAQKEFKIESHIPLQNFMKESNSDNRCEIRAEKFALFFAVDLGLDIIDDDCIERGLALARYERQVKKFLNVKDALSREGVIQQKILSAMAQAGGQIALREMEKLLKPAYYGVNQYQMALQGLVKIGWVYQWGRGVKGDPQMLALTANAPSMEYED